MEESNIYISDLNNNVGAQGRFANHFIRDLACSLIAKNSNINFTYGHYQHMIENLGIKLFTPNENTNTANFTDSIILNDNTFFKYIHNPIEKNFSLKQSFCQTHEFALFIYDYVRDKINKEHIMHSNIFNDRYNNNNDVFIHVRLGDVTHNQQENHKLEYFDKILANLNFEKGYISSDSIHNSICQNLIEKYNLEVFYNNEVETIMFASTCKHLILSGGTFSWSMGILAYDSDVYYKLGKVLWYPPEIFNMPSWKKQD